MMLRTSLQVHILPYLPQSEPEWQTPGPCCCKVTHDGKSGSTAYMKGLADHIRHVSVAALLFSGTSEQYVTMLLNSPPYIAHACADYFSRQSSPNVLLTTCYKPSKLMFHFLADMLEVLPCAQFFKRQVHSCAAFS